jgi:hypothetical protein
MRKLKHPHLEHWPNAIPGDFMNNIINYCNAHNDKQLNNLSASEAGIGVLEDMQEKLHFASDELQRIEDESGIPLNQEQDAKQAAYSRALNRIRKVFLIARKLLPPRLANRPLFETR